MTVQEGDTMPNATSGTGTREARDLDLPVMRFDLQREIELLRTEPGWASFGRSAKTLAKAPSFGVVLALVRAGVEIGNEDAAAPLSVLVLSGSATAHREGSAVAVPGGQLAWFDHDAWSLRADRDSVLLLSITHPDAGAVG